MIRYGAHSIMFVETWSDASLGILDRVRELGTDIFEISVGDDMDFTPAEVRRRAEGLGLALTAGPGGVWPAECDLSSDSPEERALGLRWHSGIVDLAAEMGAFAYCGAAYGHPGTVKRRRPPEDEYPRTAEGLHHLADYAERRGVLLVLEPMSHFRTHMVNTPEQLMRLIELADHGNIKVNLDTYHMITEVRDYAAAFHTVRDRLIGLHACENDRGCPGGGLVPWAEVFAALRRIDFDGYLMLEAYNSSIGDFAYRRGMFHNVCPDPEDYIRRGHRFLREMWNRSAAPADPE